MNDYISAGYQIIKPSKREDWMMAQYLPSVIVSGSSCICEQFPDAWCIKWASSPHQLQEHADKTGVKNEERDSIYQWSDVEFRRSFGWPGIFYTLDSAEAARSKFFKKDAELMIIGFGLHKSLIERFILEVTPENTQSGNASNGKSGYLECVEHRNPIVKGNTILGFEPLAFYEGIMTCSWICNSLQKELKEKWRLLPNKNGFIDNFNSAMVLCDAINCGQINAEPGLWLPWLIVKYS